MSTSSRNKEFTTTQAAGLIGRKPARVRQLCQKHNIGVVVNHHVRLLTQKDVDTLKTLIRPKKDQDSG